jgi:hypothetical protein
MTLRLLPARRQVPRAGIRSALRAKGWKLAHSFPLALISLTHTLRTAHPQLPLLSAFLRFPLLLGQSSKTSPMASAGNLSSDPSLALAQTPPENPAHFSMPNSEHDPNWAEAVQLAVNAGADREPQ